MSTFPSVCRIGPDLRLEAAYVVANIGWEAAERAGDQEHIAGDISSDGALGMARSNASTADHLITRLR